MVKKPFPPFFTWLALAALLDWLITRTLTRAAIFMPKPPIVLGFYQALTWFGQVASNLAGLLAFMALGWIAWLELRSKRNWLMAGAFIGIMAASLWALFVTSGGWIELIFQALFTLAILLVIRQCWMSSTQVEQKLALTLSALALLASRFYQLLPAAYSALRLPGPPALSELFFNAGELLVLVSVAALWWCYGRRAPAWAWLAASLPALGFAIPRLLNPAMTGILAIWSVGLTLYLPWPAYVVALWLAGVAVINTLRQGNPVGWAILLLVAGGYAPQLSLNAFLGLIALWMLVHAPLPASQTAQSLPATSRNARALPGTLE